MKTATLGQVRKILEMLENFSSDQVQDALASGRLHRAFAGEVEMVVNEIIRVDRSKKLVYPDWVEEVLHPELECTGPAEYSITPNSLYLHPKQKEGGLIGGHDLHKHLVDTKAIGNCAGYADLVEIQKKGIAFFRKHFKGKFVYAWKSVVWSALGGLNVPCLYEDGDEVVQNWYVLGNVWNQDYPALRVA